MKYNPVQTRLSLDLSELKALLGIEDSVLDNILSFALNSAKESADNYMNNPFKVVNQEYLSEQKQGHGLYSRRLNLNERKKFDSFYSDVDAEIPNAVKLGVIEYVRAYLHSTQTPYTVRTEKESDLTRNYRDLGSAEKYIRETYWKQYKVFWL